MEDSPMYKSGKTLTTIKELNDKLKDLVRTQKRFTPTTDPKEKKLLCEMVRETKRLLTRMYIFRSGL